VKEEMHRIVRKAAPQFTGKHRRAAAE